MRHKWNKVISIILVICVVVTLVACTNEDVTEVKNNECVTLEFWNVFTGPDGDVMQKLIEEFNDEHEGEIKIKSRVMATEGYYDMLLSSIAGGIAPDVCIMHCSYIAHFAESGLLYPMEEMTEDLNLKEEDFVEVAWKAGEYEDVRYGIPIDVHPVGIYYNVSLLKKHGYQTPPRNLEDFLKIAAACTYDNDGDGENDVWGFAIDPNVLSVQLFYTVLYQYGGDLFDKEGGDYRSQEGREALQLLHDMIYEYQIAQENLPTDSAISLFEEGKLAMYCNGPWVISELEDIPQLEFATAAFPQFGTEDGVWADSHNIVIPKQRTDNEEKEEATEVFVQYLIDHEMDWAKAGHVPVLKEVLASEEFQNLEYVTPFAEQLDNVKLPAGVPDYPDIWDSLCEYLSEVLQNEEWTGEISES